MHFHRHQNTRPSNKHGYNEVCQSHPQSRILWTLSDPAFTIKILERPLWCSCQGHNFQQHQLQDTNHQRHRIVSRYLVTIAPHVMLYDGIITLDRYKIALSSDSFQRWVILMAGGCTQHHPGALRMVTAGHTAPPGPAGLSKSSRHQGQFMSFC